MAGEGGGISINSSSPIISENIITDNEAGSGGGIWIYDYSSPFINWNIIDKNMAVYGGGIYMFYFCSPNITNNSITGNMAAASTGGGGIWVIPDCDILPVINCPEGWGTGRENIPIGSPLVPEEGEEYTIAGNIFLGNEHNTILDHSEASHVYFQQ